MSINKTLERFTKKQRKALGDEFLLQMVDLFDFHTLRHNTILDMQARAAKANKRLAKFEKKKGFEYYTKDYFRITLRNDLKYFDLHPLSVTVLIEIRNTVDKVTGCYSLIPFFDEEGLPLIAEPTPEKVAKYITSFLGRKTLKEYGNEKIVSTFCTGKKISLKGNTVTVKKAYKPLLYDGVLNESWYCYCAGEVLERVLNSVFNTDEVVLVGFPTDDSREQTGKKIAPPKPNPFVKNTTFFKSGQINITLNEKDAAEKLYEQMLEYGSAL